MVKDPILYGLAGITVGLAIGVAIFSVTSPGGKFRTFQREDGKPTVMRMYRGNMERDGIFVQSDNGEYITLREHLARIPSEADREIEDIQIRRLCGLYKE